MNRCPPNECEPDPLGFCKVCRHEVMHDVDDDGNIVECAGCTEESIITGCSLHDHVQYQKG